MLYYNRGLSSLYIICADIFFSYIDIGIFLLRALVSIWTGKPYDHHPCPVSVSSDIWFIFSGMDGIWLATSCQVSSRQNHTPHKSFFGSNNNNYGCHSELPIINTADGRNPAPPGMPKTLEIIGYLPYQLVQDFFHLQCHGNNMLVCPKRNLLLPPRPSKTPWRWIFEISESVAIKNVYLYFAYRYIDGYSAIYIYI